MFCLRPGTLAAQTLGEGRTVGAVARTILQREGGELTAVVRLH
jgi:hypothetical protein